MSVTMIDGLRKLQTLVRAHGYEFETSDVSDTDRLDVGSLLQLPPHFVALYSKGSPADGTRIAWITGDIGISSFAGLPDAQAGYRWVGQQLEERSDLWPDKWIVVADASADPIFVDSALDPCPVLFARHGMGSWEPKELAPSVPTFVESLFRVEQILLDEFDLEPMDDDSVLLPGFLNRLRGSLSEILNPVEVDGWLALIAD